MLTPSMIVSTEMVVTHQDVVGAISGLSLMAFTTRQKRSVIKKLRTRPVHTHQLVFLGRFFCIIRNEVVMRR